MSYRRPTIYVDGKQKLLSRHVMETHLGRALESSEIVHHINHDPFDNRIENLQLTTRAEHKKLHAEIGANTRLKKIWRLDEKAVLEMYKRCTIAKIAETFGCSEATVRRALKIRFGKIDLRTMRDPSSKIQHIGRILS